MLCIINRQSRSSFSPGDSIHVILEFVESMSSRDSWSLAFGRQCLAVIGWRHFRHSSSSVGDSALLTNKVFYLSDAGLAAGHWTMEASRKHHQQC